MGRMKWTKERIVEALQARHRQGLSLSSTQVDCTLRGAAQRYFGRWTAALQAAGLEPVSSARKWTRKRVIEALRAHHRKGLPLKNERVEQRLYAAAYKRFGSWHQALRAAGLEPVPRGKWTKQRVIEAIQNRSRQGLSLVTTWRTDKSLYSGAQYKFGSWRRALRAAGFRLHRRRWTKQQVLDAIRTRHQRGLSLRTTWRDESVLHSAAQRLFHSWADAVIAAGLQPHVRRRWSRQKVIETIQTRHRQSEGGRILSTEDKGLHQAAKKYWGTWRRALVAAGLTDEAQPKWSRQRIREALQARHMQGLSMVSSRVDSRLVDAARHHFGSWHDALVASGVISKNAKRRPWRRRTKQSVLQEIQARYDEGLSLKARDNQTLAAAAWRLFGGWGNGDSPSTTYGPLIARWSRLHCTFSTRGARHCRPPTSSQRNPKQPSNTGRRNVAPGSDPSDRGSRQPQPRTQRRRRFAGCRRIVRPGMQALRNLGDGATIRRPQRAAGELRTEVRSGGRETQD